MRKRNSIIFYLLINVIVSAVTMLAVLFVWDWARRDETGPLVVAGAQQPQASQPTAPLPTPTLPPLDQPVIEIQAVVAAGNLDQEVVLLRRLGEGNLSMAGWRLEGEHGNVYIFPMQPELILYQGGAVQVISRAGDDTVTEVFWDRGEAAWRGGELVRLLDSAGGERSAYRVP